MLGSSIFARTRYRKTSKVVISISCGSDVQMLRILFFVVAALASVFATRLTVPSEDDHASLHKSVFDIPRLDSLLHAQPPSILEIVSPPLAHHASGAGKTSLLYLIITHAIIPRHLQSSMSLGGQDAAIILFDPLSHFSVPRLVQVTANVIKSKLRSAGKQLDSSMSSEIKALVKNSVLHVHIFRPQSWDALIATLRSLPDYLFNPEKHHSTHRRIHSIILDDVDAFAWSIRADTASGRDAVVNPLAAASTHLTAALDTLSTLLSCAVILTSSSVSPTTLRPLLPTAWGQGVRHTRLGVRRVEVLKFAPAISAEQGELERQQRWDVVSKGRFECKKVGPGARDEEGFWFRVGAWGVEVEQASSEELRDQ